MNKKKKRKKKKNHDKNSASGVYIVLIFPPINFYPTNSFSRHPFAHLSQGSFICKRIPLSLLHDQGASDKILLTDVQRRAA